MRGAREIVNWIATLIPPVEGALTKPRRIDLLLAALLAVGSLAEFPFMASPFPGFALVVGLIWAAAVAYRRVMPLLVVALVTAMAISGDVVAAVTDKPLVGTVSGGLSVFVILYSVGRWAPRSTVIGSIVAGLLLSSTGFLNPSNDPAWISFLAEVAVSVTMIAIGVLVRSRDVLKAQRARADLAEERNELANDIHDNVAHHMSAIAVLAEGALQLTNQDHRDEALDAIKRSASTGLADVRQLVSNIRNTDDMPRPLPGFGDLKQLAEESSTPSLQVDLAIDVAAETIPVTVAAVAHAIVREALTNVRRHATGATKATVRARITEQFLDLTIADDGATPTTRSSTPGFGISVMTERANSVGGHLSAGPNPTGGWLVAGRLPLISEGVQ